ncbi:hypothetical protein AN958_04255 [Leucoagaricus sp. SymC.cos]|nr:hypothetical protein AN958_04255 [Leucoagaricus sp. SymC.cos]
MPILLPSDVQLRRHTDVVQLPPELTNKPPSLTRERRQGSSSDDEHNSGADFPDASSPSPDTTSFSSDATAQPSSSTDSISVTNSLPISTSYTVSQTLLHPYPNSTQHSSPSDREQRGDAKAIIIGVIGGILGLLILALIAFRLIRRYQQKAQKRVFYESFWETWHWVTYSQVHEDATFGNECLGTGETAGTSSGGGVKAGQGEGSRSRYPWWQKYNFSALSMTVNGGLGKRRNKKTRAKTLYKVTRLKPGEKFDIDSCSSLGES